MSAELSSRSAAALGVAGIAPRLFYAALIETPVFQNAAWLGILLSGVLSVPPILFAMLLMRSAGKQTPRRAVAELLGKPASRGFALLLGLVLLIEAGYDVDSIAGSASHVAQERIPEWSFVLGTSLALFAVLRQGLRGASGLSLVWLRIAPWLLLLTVLSQLRAYAPAYLTPVLGPGLPTILSGALRISGFPAMFAALCVCQDNEDIDLGGETSRASPARFFRALTLAVLLASGAAVLTGMLSPVMPELSESRIERLDAILSNGRTNLSTQFPLVILWYGSMIVSLALFACLGARMIGFAFPSLRPGLTAFLCGAILTIAALLESAGLLDTRGIRFLQYPLLTAPLIFAWARSIVQRRRGLA